MTDDHPGEAGGAPEGGSSADADADLELDDDQSDEFVREVARVEDVPPPLLQSALQPQLGQRVAHFRVLAELGRGRMGIVYLAQDEKLRRPVALEVLPPSLSRHEERRRRFLREARAAAAVSDPHLAAIYEVDEVEGRIYIAMERIEGRTLRQILASRRLSVEEAVDLAGQVAAGLARAHARPILTQAARSCEGLESPQLHTEANHYLGQALERSGDTSSACAAYAVVLRRWGSARPPSRTAAAARARARARALRCAESRGSSRPTGRRSAGPSPSAPAASPATRPPSPPGRPR